MEKHFLILTVTVPLATATLIPLLSIRWERAGFWLASLALLFSFGSALILVGGVLVDGRIAYHVGGWAPPWGIEIFLDWVGAFFLLLASSLSLAVAIFSRIYVEQNLEASKIPLFYVLLLLLAGGMIGFILAGDIFNMFIFFEIFSLSSYALVAISGGLESLKASFRYLLMGTISSLFVLLGIGLLYSLTGTLYMPLLAQELGVLPYSGAIRAATALILVAFGIEAALFPLHVWLPGAHSLAPSPVSALLSGLVIKMGVYGMIKVLFYILGGRGSSEIGALFSLMAATAIIVGALFALRENDIKLIFAHSSVSQIGYVILGIYLFSYFGLAGGLLQVLNHALAKSALFLCAGVVISQAGFRRLEDLRGIGRRMPFLMVFFTIALASLASLPFTCGFASKYYLCKGAIERGEFWLAGIVLLGSFLTLLYCVKIVNYIFFATPAVGRGGGERSYPEVSPWMMVPIGVLGFGSLLVGIFPGLSFILIKPAVLGLLGMVR